MKKLNEQNGITLVALLITIIILLILAGVTINLLIGNNGLFKTAEQAVKNYTNAQDRELELINELGNTIKEASSGGKDYNAEKKVNKPVTEGTGLIPVIINNDGTLEQVSDKDENWYDYIDTSVIGQENKSKWANAKTKDDSLWVWIPRYAYKITYTNPSNKSAGGTIDVVFLKDTSNKDFNGNDVTNENYIDEKGNKGAYIVHPAFKDGRNNGYANGEWNKEITGFWMAKFEAGYVGEANNPNSAQDSTVALTVNNQTTNYYGIREEGDLIKYPVFKANRPSINYLGISDAFDLCKSLKTNDNPYGFTDEVDSHLTKNSEWGAVAYLTHSKYGINGQEIGINNVCVDRENTIYGVTGYGSFDNANVDKSRDLATLTLANTAGNWTTANGQTASSTKNIYGIYDLRGGLSEWTAGYMASDEEAYQNYGGSLKGESNEYKSQYIWTSHTGASNYNQETNKLRKGEAIWETSANGSGQTSWNSCYSHFISAPNPFMARGGDCGDAAYADIFSFDGWDGSSSYYYVGFRSILVTQ